MDEVFTRGANRIISLPTIPTMKLELFIRICAHLTATKKNFSFHLSSIKYCFIRYSLVKVFIFNYDIMVYNNIYNNVTII